MQTNYTMIHVSISKAHININLLQNNENTSQPRSHLHVRKH